MRFDEVVLQGADPGANLGAAFTASLSERPLIPKLSYLDSFFVGMKTTTSTAAVTLPTFLDLLQPFVFKAGQETRIQLRGRDLLMLSAFIYGSVPFFWAANATSDDEKIMGIRVPIWETINPAINYAWSASRVAQTNVAGEVFELAAQWHDKTLQPKPIIAVEQPFTTAGATGRTNLNIQIPEVGTLIGLMLFNNVATSNTSDTNGVQRVQFYLNGNRSSQFNVGTRGWLNGFNQDNQELLMQSVYSNYTIIDLRDDPIDLTTTQLGIEVDVESTSASARLIPIIIKK